MTNEIYQVTQDQLVIGARYLSALDMDGFRARISRSEAIAPIVDPTLYRQAHRRLEAINNLAAAAQSVQAALRALNAVVSSEDS